MHDVLVWGHAFPARPFSSSWMEPFALDTRQQTCDHTQGRVMLITAGSGVHQRLSLHHAVSSAVVAVTST
jgi:hypothetical protein